ncbi:hypothetical protein Lal_00030755 [Lupinus albus]|uniref:VQ domain-containing protein n=1 Tax=Lupinus albus TaxID=3870 RepID=A0A6A5LRI9_LUPAL|nr:hypothetical protein Lalb_Chr17g0344161 [Lupinus albus]KAF1863677.1 hypothetical protein Lal_00030755 [Lupinus albus]
MDSGNSGSISSSGDEEYYSRVDHTTLLPSNILNHSLTQFAKSSSFVSSLQHQIHHNNPSLFDLSSSYLHSLSQPQPNTNPNSFLNLDTTTNSTSQGKRSEPNCTNPANLQGFNQGLFPPPHGLGHDDNNNARLVSSAPTNNAVVRNSKKRTRASRRTPTTVLTTDTSNFRAMVQEFTGIPAPPFSGSSSYSRTRRLDLLTGSSSSLRATASHYLDTTPSFYPLRPSPQKPHHQQNPFPSTFLHHNNNNMVDAIAFSITNNNSNSINYQLPPDLGLPYHHNHSHNIIQSMQQNHLFQTFHQTPPLHPLGNHGLSVFGAKSQASLSVQSLDELGMSNNADIVGAYGVSGPQVSSDHGNGDRRELNFSTPSAASSRLNHEKNLENNSSASNRGEGNVDSWICSSD